MSIYNNLKKINLNLSKKINTEKDEFEYPFDEP